MRLSVNVAQPQRYIQSHWEVEIFS